MSDQTRSLVRAWRLVTLWQGIAALTAAVAVLQAITLDWWITSALAGAIFGGATVSAVGSFRLTRQLRELEVTQREVEVRVLERARQASMQ